MSRYRVSGMWSHDRQVGDFIIQSADIVDVKNGQRYQEGAFRVVRMSDGKPAKTGKGGTVPFYGEMAWADAQRLALDLDSAVRYAR